MSNAIIVFHQKHTDRFFPANTSAEIEAACLKIVKEMAPYYATPQIPRLDQVPQLTETWNDARAQATVAKTTLESRRKMQWYRETLDDYNLLLQAIDGNDGKAARQLIENRSNGEYEGFEYETMEEGDYGDE